MGFFDSPDEMIRKQGEAIDDLDRKNEALDAEMVEMAKEFAASMQALGVPADGRGLWAAGKDALGLYYADRDGRHFFCYTSTSGREQEVPEQVHYYRPGMRVDLARQRDEAKERFRHALEEVAREVALRERQEG